MIPRKTDPDLMRAYKRNMTRWLDRCNFAEALRVGTFDEMMVDVIKSVKKELPPMDKAQMREFVKSSLDLALDTVEKEDIMKGKEDLVV